MFQLLRISGGLKRGELAAVYSLLVTVNGYASQMRFQCQPFDAQLHGL